MLDLVLVGSLVVGLVTVGYGMSYVPTSHFGAFVAYGLRGCRVFRCNERE